MGSSIVAVGLVAAGLVGWFGLYGLLLVATRPRSVRPLPATRTLGPEPPAVVSLLVNGWQVTEAAAQATLLDLGARRILELRRGTDGRHGTTVHIRQDSPAGLTPYERRVFERVAALAVNGVVPLSVLGSSAHGLPTPGSSAHGSSARGSSARGHVAQGRVGGGRGLSSRGKAQFWWKHLQTEVVADARTRGLSRRRFGSTIVAVLLGAAGIAAVCVAAGVRQLVPYVYDVSPWVASLSAGILCGGALATVATRRVGERPTRAGREVAAHWQGVRLWLCGHEALAEQPPSAVDVWGQFLSYGVAVGAARVASAALSSGTGTCQRPWPSPADMTHVPQPRATDLAGTAPAGTDLPESAVTRTGLSGTGLTETGPAETRSAETGPATPEPAAAGGTPEASHAATDVDDQASEAGQNPLAVVAGGAPSPALLSAEEASQALGFPVTRIETALPGQVALVQFSATDSNRVVLMLQVLRGTMGKLAWQDNAHGTRLAGIGDGAWAKGDKATARRGDATVLLTLTGAGKGRRRRLPWLLQKTVSRIS